MWNHRLFLVRQRSTRCRCRVTRGGWWSAVAVTGLREATDGCFLSHHWWRKGSVQIWGQLTYPGWCSLKSGSNRRQRTRRSSGYACPKAMDKLLGAWIDVGDPGAPWICSMRFLNDRWVTSRNVAGFSAEEGRVKAAQIKSFAVIYHLKDPSLPSALSNILPDLFCNCCQWSTWQVYPILQQRQSHANSIKASTSALCLQSTEHMTVTDDDVWYCKWTFAAVSDRTLPSGGLLLKKLRYSVQAQLQMPVRRVLDRSHCPHLGFNLWMKIEL